MERNNDKISSIQLSFILVITIIGSGILSLPSHLSKVVGSDFWILIILSSLVTVVLSIFISLLVSKFPNETMIEFSNSLLGKILGTILSLVFFIYLIVITATELRIFGEIAKVYILLNTPIEILMITMILTASYLARSGIESIARISQVILPIVVFLASLFIMPLIPELDSSNFLPVLQTPILKIIKFIPRVVFNFIGIELVLIFSAFVIDIKNIKRNSVFAVIFVAIVYFLIVSITMTRFGVAETSHSVWPVLELFKTIDLPGAFIENIEIYIIGIWIISLFMTLSIYYFGASLTLSRILRSKEQNYFVLPLLIIIYFIAMVPDNIAQILNVINIYMNYICIFYIVFVPIILLLISIVKKKKVGKKHV